MKSEYVLVVFDSFHPYGIIWIAGPYDNQPIMAIASHELRAKYKDCEVAPFKLNEAITK